MNIKTPPEINKDVKSPGKIRGFLKALFIKVNTFMTSLDNKPVLQLLVYALLINYCVESLSRHSPIAGFVHIFTSPIAFLYNMLLIMLTLSLSLLFKKKHFVFTIVSVAWLTLGVINCIILLCRTTPLGAEDFSFIKTLGEIMNVYFSIPQIILMGLLILAVIGALVFVWLKCSPRPVKYFKSALTILLLAVMIALVTPLSIRLNALSNRFGNIADAYKKYGFAYCFSCTVFDRGIDKPKDYSRDSVETILRAIMNNQPTEPEKIPNIIMVQLESFFDVRYVKGLTCSQDPTPNFNSLKENYSSGFLTVPSIGAGTANTEFEVITGMNLDYFGVGEYPYKTVMKNTTCETVCYNLKELGYTCHAIHNNSGSFYDRNSVFSNLGFDTFTSLEYMNDVEFTLFGWAKDNILSREIMGALNSTESDRDFIYTITVQGHGKYPAEIPEDIVGEIKVTGIENEAESNQYEYFVNQIHATDDFIGELINTLGNFNEKTVVVFFGDHLPHFGYEDEDLTNSNIYQTEYVIWSNYPLEKKDRDLNSYQLTAHLFDILGYNNGDLTKLHQNYSDNENYQKALEMLEYDFLYGDQLAYGHTNPYYPTDLKMGHKNIHVNGFEVNESEGYVKGENFTPWSVVYINDKQYETTFIDSNTLMITLARPTDIPEYGSLIYVAQQGKDKINLSRTEEYIYQEQDREQYQGRYQKQYREY